METVGGPGIVIITAPIGLEAGALKLASGSRTLLTVSKAEIGAVDFALARSASTFDGPVGIKRLGLTDDALASAGKFNFAKTPGLRAESSVNSALLSKHADLVNRYGSGSRVKIKNWAWNIVCMLKLTCAPTSYHFLVASFDYFGLMRPFVASVDFGHIHGA